MSETEEVAGTIEEEVAEGAGDSVSVSSPDMESNGTKKSANHFFAFTQKVVYLDIALSK